MLESFVARLLFALFSFQGPTIGGESQLRLWSEIEGIVSLWRWNERRRVKWGSGCSWAGIERAMKRNEMGGEKRIGNLEEAKYGVDTVFSSDGVDT